MSSKKELGQFYTTQCQYIMTEIMIPAHVKNIIEPFSGNGDLINFIKSFNKDFVIESYDIDPKIPISIKQDTLKNPPIYDKKYIITNPPFLARNKSSNKEIFDKYNSNDLYKCFILELLKQDPIGGIIIVPLNFWCSIRKNDVLLRKQFVEKFFVARVNVFEEQVFDDTSYSICCIQFEKRINEIFDISFHFFPNKELCIIKVDEKNNFTIGGELYLLPKTNKYTVKRLVNGMKPNSFILLKCIDDANQLGLSFERELYYDNTLNKSERSYATLVIEPPLTILQQKLLIKKFNHFISEKRLEYKSLFLANYREKSRKRISFQLAYTIIGNLLDQYL
jgi:hypothetical protein